MSLNVFQDLGFDEGYASEMDLRVAVAVQIHDLIKARELTQHEASQLFGVPQPTISKIARLKLDRISLSLLLRMLFKSGTPFTIDFGGDPQSISATVANPRNHSKVVQAQWDMAGGASEAAPATGILSVERSISDTQPEVWQASDAGPRH